MPLPVNALRVGQLELQTAGSAADAVGGSHKIYRANFIRDGVQQTGFFKTLDAKYPKFLAALSVATSTLLRSFLGEKAAEEVLVYDDADNILGTLSVAIDGFKPLNFFSNDDVVPDDPREKEKVIPSTATLLEYQMIEYYLAMFLVANDDAHPHNVSREGIIDFDMCFYPISGAIKGWRPGIGAPPKERRITAKAMETFPIIVGPYHWCTHYHPGKDLLPEPTSLEGAVYKRVLPKAYPEPLQFRQLAVEPLAHEQKLAVSLRALITNDPEMLRNRLLNQLGDMQLNYTDLPPETVAYFETEHPDLFNRATNSMYYVDFIIALYQKQYDALYCAVVFYMGCQNNGAVVDETKAVAEAGAASGIPLPSTESALRKRPDRFKEILAWAEAENNRPGNRLSANTRFDPKKLEQRYHQVWRDSYVPRLQELIQKLHTLTKEMIQQFTISNPEIAAVQGKAVIDPSLTEVMQIFGPMPKEDVEKLKGHLALDMRGELPAGFQSLVEFANSFYSAVETYYSKDWRVLTRGDSETPGDSLIFSTTLRELYNKSSRAIRTSLGQTTTNAREFFLIASELDKIGLQVDFETHVFSTDEMIYRMENTAPAVALPSHKSSAVLDESIAKLFLWVDGLTADGFKEMMDGVVNNKYKALWQTRAAPVKAYLAAARACGVGNSDQLAYILSSGTTQDGALNTAIIQACIPLMAQQHSIPSLNHALRSKDFEKDIRLFVSTAVAFAQLQKYVVLQRTDEGVVEFYRTLYDWVHHLDRTAFNAIIETALTAKQTAVKSTAKAVMYGLSMFAAYVVPITPEVESREDAVRGFCRTEDDCDKALARIFHHGEPDSGSNLYLFKTFVDMIKEGQNVSPDIASQPGCKLICQYNPATDKARYYGDGTAQNNILRAQAEPYRPQTRSKAVAGPSNSLALA